MEPSEQCSYNESEDHPYNHPIQHEDLPSDEEVAPVEEGAIVEAPLTISQEESEHGPQVYSFSEVPPDAEDGYIELNGQHFVFERGSVDGEFYVLVPEGQVVTLEAIKDDEEEPTEGEFLPTEDISHNIETHSSIEIERQGTVEHEDSDQMEYLTDNQVEDHGDVKYLTIREVSNGVAYVQTPPDSFASTKSLPEERIKNEKLLNLAAVAQEIQSADAHSATVDHFQDPNSPSLTEGSVIVSQIHPDTDSVSMYPNSETEEDTATDLASEHDSKSGFGETSMDNAEAEPIAVERRTSFSCISSTRTVDNTVSVIHTTSSTYIHDELEKDTESSNVSNDCNVKLRLDMSAVDSEQSEDSVPDLQENLSQDNCSNQNDKFSNQDEDSVLSQNCGLDLTKESNVVSPSCEDSLPAVEHIRSRYGIMDALNKDKQTSYYDIHTSEDIEDTINSSSRSTNITEDAESVSENNSDDLESNNTKDVVSEIKLSPEKLSIEYDNSNSKLDAEVIETSEKVSPITVQSTNNESKGLLSKTNRSFRLPSNPNSNSKNSEFSENLSTPSLLTKELNSVKIDLSPRQKSKVVDAYDFDDSSTEAENDSNLQISVSCQDDNDEVMEEEANPKGFATEINVDEDESTQKLTFQDVLDKEEDTNKEKCEENFNESSDLFNSSSELEENEEIRKTQEEKLNNLESLIPEPESVLNKNDYPEQSNTEKPAFDEPCSSKVNDDLCLMDTEESFVKTPQKTYMRKRKLTQQNFELFSCADLSATKDVEKEKTSIWKDPDGPVAMDDDDDIPSDVQSKVSCKKKRKSSPSGVQFHPSPIQLGDETEDDMDSNDVQSKVSATYKRKRKSGPCPQVVRANRARSLRPRSSQTEESLENGTVDTSLCDLEERITSQEKLDTEEANWGAILLGTQFNSNASPSEPPTPSSTSPSNSQRSRERKKPAYFTMANSKKSPLASGKQFDKLIKSSPTKVKSDTATDKKKILHDKVKKQAMSLCNSLSPHSARIHAKRGRPKAKVTRVSNVEAPLASYSGNKKMSQIEIVPFLCHFTEKETTGDENPTISKPDTDLKYNCDQCSFTTSKSNNLLMHFKLRCKNNHYNHNEVHDPNKLLLLRGDEASALLDAPDNKSKHKSKNTKVSSDHWNGSSRDSIDQPSCSIPLRSKKSDKDKDDAIHAKKKFGFAKTDVVWVKQGRWHWPALVWDISDKDTLLYVISSPNHCEPLKIASQSLGKMVHSFDDVEFSKTLLENAKKMPNNNIFFKAVQKADSYTRKKILDDEEGDFDAKTYFNIIETTDKPPRKKQPFLLENIDTDITTKDIDICKVLNCIWSGKCDEHVLSIHSQSIPSERHELFEKNEFAKELEDMSWFGPLKTDSDTQLKLYDHFYGLYKRNISSPANVSYIYKVWIPEAIIKAISFVNKISFDEAELIFLKQETFEDIIAL